MTAAQKMKAGARALGRLARLLEKSSGLFDVDFEYHGRVAPHDQPHLTDPYVRPAQVYGRAVVYPLLQGRRIGYPGSGSWYFIATVDLGSGEAKVADPPYAGWAGLYGRESAKERQWAGTGPHRTDPVSFEELEVLWNHATQKVRHVFEDRATDRNAKKPKQ